MDHYIGRLLDERYEILEQVGNGGMAYVYKARCNRLNRNVAIKILKEEMSRDEEFRRRFHAESQAVAMLSHPNIVGVYDVSHSDNLDYIVMELIEGITLKQYMEQKGQLNWREALHFTIQIAKALEHAHSRGIIHRDIKPHNIMILKDGSVKVADFGIAQISNVQATLTSEALGSVHYISPEQAKGAHIDERADLYSLGVVLYEMLCGRPPYDGETPVSVAIQHIHGTPAKPRALNPAVPEGLEEITLHAMKADPDARYTSASEMLADLEAFRKNPDTNFLTEQGEFVSAHRLRRDNARKTSVAEAKVKSPASSRTAIITGAVCIVLAFCGIGYFLYSFFFSGLFTKTAEDTVPNFIGHAYETIDPSLHENFTIELKTWRSSDEFAYGVVMDQSPTANRTAKVGSTIELTVSSGSEGNKMPNLVNLSLQNAQSLLNTMSVSVVVEVAYKPSDVYTDGYVVGTVPEQGATLTDGQIVTLYVSQGSAAELVRVPALVGVDVEQALLMIDQAQLARGSVLSVDSDLPAGTVTFQSIDSDEQVKKGTVINLQVARGSLHAQVPNLVGQSRDVVGCRGDEITLEVNVESTDGGLLTYSWYASKTPDVENAKVVAASSEKGARYQVDTTKTGTQYYFCRIVNTRGTSSEMIWSDPICVEIAKERPMSEKQIELILPEKADRYVVAVYVGGEMQIEPFEIDTNELTGNGLYLTVSGTGTQTVTAFVNGDEYDNWLIDFDTAG